MRLWRLRAGQDRWRRTSCVFRPGSFSAGQRRAPWAPLRNPGGPLGPSVFAPMRAGGRQRPWATGGGLPQRRRLVTGSPAFCPRGARPAARAALDPALSHTITGNGERLLPGKWNFASHGELRPRLRALNCP